MGMASEVVLSPTPHTHTHTAGTVRGEERNSLAKTVLLLSV